MKKLNQIIFKFKFKLQIHLKFAQVFWQKVQGINYFNCTFNIHNIVVPKKNNNF